jgi:hypothetical protein
VKSAVAALTETPQSCSLKTQIGRSMHPQVIEETAVRTVAHLISPPESEWSFWRWVCLRSAGFPIDGIYKLAAPQELSFAADDVTEALQAVERIRAKALKDVNSALDELRSTGRWEDKKTRKALLKARDAIIAQDIPRNLPESGPFKAIEWETASRRLEEMEVRFRQQFSRACEQTTETIREIASLPGFREAVTWQNRGLVERVLDVLLRKAPGATGRNSRQRQSEELVAMYWQRYCAKNDTIGFFGPVGWAEIVPEVESLFTKPGEPLFTARKTYWEAWAIEALGAAILRNADIRRWVAPILMPFLRVSGPAVHHPLVGTVPLTQKQAALLQVCDGNQTARQIAENLVRLPASGFRAEGEVYQALEEFATRRMVFWSFNIPRGPHPERALRTELQRIEDLHQRRSAMAVLDDLETAKQKVDLAAGSADKLGAALNHLEELFALKTGVSATRNPGKVYAGRTLIYEDGLRNVEVNLGPALIQSFASPLSLLLIAGKWFTAQVADVYRKKLYEIHSRYIGRARQTRMDLATLWAQAMPLFLEEGPALVAPVQKEFQRKWEKILNLGSVRGAVSYSCAELGPEVAREFSSIRPGWITARYHSPDIMIAASSEEAIHRGECLFVMGEAHIATNTLDGSLFVNQHPSPDDLLQAVEHDLKGLSVVPIGYNNDELGCRTTPSLVSKSSFRLEYLPNSFVSDRRKSVPASSMFIENHGGELMAKTRDGRFCLKVIDLVGPILSGLVVDCFKIMKPRSHTPRMVIDQLVIKRESWSFSPAELEFSKVADPAECFFQVRRWAKSYGIPRFGFYKVPVEKKPAYLDFESPILVSIFSRLVRKTQETASPDSTVDISEMLPTAEQMWLRDTNNRRYASEFRFVAVDSVDQSPKEVLSGRSN